MLRYIIFILSFSLLAGCAMETTSEAEQEDQQYIYQEAHLQGYDYLTKEKTDEVIVYSDFLLSKPAGTVGSGDKVLLVKRVRQAVFVESTDGLVGWISVRNVKEMDDMFPQDELAPANRSRQNSRRGQ